MDHESAIAPVRGTRPKVGRNPVTPFTELGDEMIDQLQVDAVVIDHDNCHVPPALLRWGAIVRGLCCQDITALPGFLDL